MFRFWRNMDDDDKSRLVRIIGLVVALAAVFTLLSTVSYFFTWKADQSSLTSAVGDTTVEVSNAGGNLATDGLICLSASGSDLEVWPSSSYFSPCPSVCCCAAGGIRC